MRHLEKFSLRFERFWSSWSIKLMLKFNLEKIDMNLVVFCHKWLAWKIWSIVGLTLYRVIYFTIFINMLVGSS